ncbi:MAG TPA: hypothetical protein GXZ90_00415 [Clostridiales bacterium]|nr:hypothetical protein [Clostridiales bacterium]
MSCLKTIVDNLILRLFENINEDIDKNTLQKKVYLLQSMNIDLGYDFIWYLRGPYSQGLGERISELPKEIDNDYDKIMLRQDILENIIIINNLILLKPDNLNVEMWYRLLASMTFININQYMWNNRWPNKSPEEILQSEMPIYAMEDCVEAQKVLKDMKHIQ